MPAQPDAGRRDIARLVDAGRDQHGVMALAQLVERDVAADFAVQLEGDARRRAAASSRRCTMSFSSLKFGMP